MWFPLTILSAFLWAVINVGHSTIVARYHKTPWILMWVQTCLSMVFLMLIALHGSVSTSWMGLLFLVGLLAYVGDLFFFWILDRLDVSVVNAAWAIGSLALSIVGFTFFHEAWSPSQFLGSLLIIGGVLFLSFFHAHVTFRSTIVMLVGLALCYLPLAVVRKAAMLAGQPVLPVLFWLILGRDLVGFLFPLFSKQKRTSMFNVLSRCPPTFYILSALTLCSFYGAELVMTLAYRVGPVSLISIVGNIQPFFVLALGAFLLRYLPSFAPKEFFSLRSTSIKLLSFSIVFLGLALLAMPQ
jgi:multidrug transporter EmrE-like cation transporter